MDMTGQCRPDAMRAPLAARFFDHFTRQHGNAEPCLVA